MRPVFLKRNHVVAFKRRQTLVNLGLGPRRIVVVMVGEFGDAIVDQLARGILDGCVIAGCDMRLYPRFLFGCEGYRHALLYRKSRPISTVKSS